MTDYVITGLVKRRATLAGEIEALHERLRGLLADLESLDAQSFNSMPAIRSRASSPRRSDRRKIGRIRGK